MSLKQPKSLKLLDDIDKINAKTLNINDITNIIKFNFFQAKAQLKNFNWVFLIFIDFIKLKKFVFLQKIDCLQKQILNER